MNWVTRKNKKPASHNAVAHAEVAKLLQGYSIEVVPQTAAAIQDFRAVLPRGTRVYLAHIEGTPIEDMVATAARIKAAGFDVMPHFPARLIHDKATLADWIARYQGEAGVRQALLIAGGMHTARGAFDSSMQLIETGLFDKADFDRLHVAGHPEGNLDIDPDGTDRHAMDALRWKQAFYERSDAEMAIVTQFLFDAKPVIRWSQTLQSAGIKLPIHVGVAGPTRLKMLMKYAAACGVGASLSVLKKRAPDLRSLLFPYAPTDVISDIATYNATHSNSNISGVHFFPFGGVEVTCNWAKKYND
jgi:methylenetetrahydrofolate reductase (NADPH)